MLYIIAKDYVNIKFAGGKWRGIQFFDVGAAHRPLPLLALYAGAHAGAPLQNNAQIFILPKTE